MFKTITVLIYILFALAATFVNVLNTALAALPLYENRSTSINFVNFGEQHGLSHPVVYDVEQDANGLIWIATQGGLHRYDGKNLIQYSYSPSDDSSISSNWVWDIHLDMESRLWIASEAGFHLYLPEQDKFRNFVKSDALPEIRGKKYRIIAEAPTGELWFGSQDSGITVLDPNTLSLRALHAEVDKEGSLSSDEIRDIHFDKQGNVWIATEGGGINLLQPNTANFQHLTTDTITTLPTNDLRSIYRDSHDRLWIGTNENGVLTMDIDTDGLINKIIENHTEIDCAQKVRDIHQSKDGTIRLATDQGLCQWQDEAEAFIRYQHDRAIPDSLISNNVNSIFEDTGGVIWVSTYEGISRWNATLRPFQQINKTSLPELTSDVISAFATQADGTLYVGTWGGGLNIISPENREVRAINHQPNMQGGLTDNRIMSLHVDNQGQLWVGTFAGGLNLYNSKDDTFVNWQHDPEDTSTLSANAISSIISLSDDTLLVGTYGGGLNLITANGLVSRLHGEVKSESNLLNNRVTSLAANADDSTFVWVGTQGGGLSRYNRVTGKFIHFTKGEVANGEIKTDNVFSILLHNDEIWLATQDVGVVRMSPIKDREGYKVRHYNRATGLNSDFAYGLVADELGYIWVSHSRGLSRIDPNSEEVFNFNKTHGLQGLDFNAGAYHKGHQGRMFFGGANGFNTFLPDQVPINDYLPPISFTRFKLLNNVIPVNRAFRAGGNIVLEYTETFVDFEFASLDYTRPQQNQYEYKIDELYDQWIGLENNNHVALSSLSDGNYTLRVRATNSDGIWSEDQLIIPITVLAPWWRGSAALSVYFILLASIVFFVYRKRLAKIEAQNRYREHLEKEVKQRTKELESTNCELAVAIDDAEKAKVSAERAAKVKSDFLATMSHEIRTPMNSVIGMSDMLVHSKLDDTQSQYATAVNKAAHALLSLINDILDFSKLEASKIRLEKNNIVLRELVEEAIFLFAHTAQEKGLEITFEITPDCPEQINGDAMRLRQVLQNLISNSIKFTHFGYVNVYVSTSSNGLDFRVEDSGIGIAEENQQRIFSAFEQADTSTTRKFGGTGLGLAICKKLIEAMDGKIGLQSKENKGTTFTFTLPSVVGYKKTIPEKWDLPFKFHVLIAHEKVQIMIKSLLDRLGVAFSTLTIDTINRTHYEKEDIIFTDESLLGDPATYETIKHIQCRIVVLRSLLAYPIPPLENALELNKPVKHESLKHLIMQLSVGESIGRDSREISFPQYKQTVLLVEDVKTNQQVAIAMLSLFGIEPVIANNGAEALELLKTIEPDLIFMDCQMPVMDGFEATRCIRLYESDNGLKRKKIVALTAAASESDHTACLDAGMDHYLIKPFTISQLSDLLSGLSTNENDVFTQSTNVLTLAPSAEEDDLIDLTTLADIKHLEQRIGRSIYQKVYSSFCEEFDSKLAQIKDSANQNELDAVCEIAHAMKSLSGNAGAAALTKICADLELIAKTQNKRVVLQKIQQMSECFDDSKIALTNYSRGEM